jgi:hypothetical protein
MSIMGVLEDIPWNGGDTLVAKSLKEKCVNKEVKPMVGIIELIEIWSTIHVCYEHPEKYIAEELLPIMIFRRYRAFDNAAI